ncbi:hypothetical protein [Okeania sp. SIO2G4]|nr:hypothetical protein [Okeania sp. SIO2G4]
MGTQIPTNCKHRVDDGVLYPKEKDNIQANRDVKLTMTTGN